ncbi:MAG: hypothetical protein ACI4IF_05825 [Acutalibacteraceae bacterium]
MKQAINIDNKIFLTLLLTVVIFVIFTSCGNKNNNGDNNADNTQSPSRYETVNSNDVSDVTSPAYGFEEDDVETPKKDSGYTEVSTTSKNETKTSSSEASNKNSNKPGTTVPEVSNKNENKPGTTASEASNKNETESESNQSLLPPKSGSQQGEWGASVKN